MTSLQGKSRRGGGRDWPLSGSVGGYFEVPRLRPIGECKGKGGALIRPARVLPKGLTGRRCCEAAET